MSDPSVNPVVFVLTHEYFDKSAFRVCGVTLNYEVALAWFKANDENDVYDCEPGKIVSALEGRAGWRSRERAK